MIEKIREILKGIDKDISQDNDGWWETSTGSEFGAKKLKEIESLVKNCSILNVSQQSELLFDFVAHIAKQNEYVNEVNKNDIDSFLSNNCG